jgi:hypothetical protein
LLGFCSFSLNWRLAAFFSKLQSLDFISYPITVTVAVQSSTSPLPGCGAASHLCEQINHTAADADAVSWLFRHL